MVRRVVAAGLLAALFLLSLPVPGAAAGDVRMVTPAEGRTVQAPVMIDFAGSLPEGIHYFATLEVAPGVNAAAGFQRVPLTPVLPAAGVQPWYKPLFPVMLPYYHWEAIGVSGGPYTLRLTVYDANKGELLGQVLRNVRLDAPDHSPGVTLDVPAAVAGLTPVTGTVRDADLLGWSLVWVDSAGTESALAEGSAGGAIRADWDTGTLPAGDYTVKLTARDAAGNVTTAARTVTARSAAPRLILAPAQAEAAPWALPFGYSADAPVRVAVSLHAGDGAVVARGQADGPAGANLRLDLPLDLTTLAPGAYTARVRAEDTAGRVAAVDGMVQVLVPVPRPVLAQVPAAVAGEVTLRWTRPADAAVTGFEVLRTAPEGTQRLEQLPADAAAFVDRPAAEGGYTYRVVALAADGRRAESAAAVTVVDRTPPVPGEVSVSLVDGAGLHLRWTGAEDAGGISAYRVVLGEGPGRQAVAALPADARSFALPLPEGGYQVTLEVADRAGNTAATAPLAFRVRPGAVPLLRNGRFLPADVPGFIEAGRTWVPLRLFGETLGYRVHWDARTETASVVDLRTFRTVVVTVGGTELRVFDGGSDRRVALPTPPRLTDGRMLVPLRPLVEALGAQVQWHPALKAVEILPEK